MAAARAMWTGAISFGLVNIPVKLFPAIHENTIHFHMLHDEDNARLQRKMVCPVDGKEVHPEHTVKGYEVGPDQYVRIRTEELEAIAPEKARTIEIKDFVPLEGIDPMYFDRSYYLEPQEHAAKAYKLIVTAMEKAGKVAIARFVMRGTEYLACLRPVDGVLMLETMHFAEEVTTPEELPGMPVKAEIGDRELKAAEQLVASLSTDFEPERYQNEHRQRVLELIEKKGRGEQVVVQPPVERAKTGGGDLLAALQASLDSSRRRNPRDEGGERSPGRKGAARKRKKV